MLRGFLDDLIDADVKTSTKFKAKGFKGSYIAKIETELIIDEDTGKLIRNLIFNLYVIKNNLNSK